MKILAVSYRSPVPTVRGDAVRLLGVMRELAVDHSVTCCFPAPSPKAVDELATVGIRVIPARRALPAIRHMDRLPLQVAAFTRWRVPQAELTQADIVHLSTVRSVALVHRRELARCHVDFIDSLAENMKQRAMSERTPLRFLLQREGRLLEHLEHETAASARSSTAVTSQEASRLGRRVAIVPNGVELVEVGAASACPVIAFVGNLGYFPNVEAARFLAVRVLPLVRRQIGDAELHLVGATPSRAVLNLERLEGVRLFADVPSVLPHFESSWVAAAPIFSGTGLQNKLLEAMAHFRPVVTTTLGASRIEGATCNVHLLCADTADEFAARVLDLMTDRIRARDLAEAGKRFVRDWSWKRRAHELVAAYSTTPPRAD